MRVFQHKSKDKKNTLGVLFYSRDLTDTHVFKSHWTLVKDTGMLPKHRKLSSPACLSEDDLGAQSPSLSLGMKPWLRTGAGQRGALQRSRIL